MKSANLKRMIGICHFVVTAIILLVFNKTPVVDLQKFFICCAFGFLGLGGRTFVYYGLLQETEKRELNKKEIKDCILAYFLYYPIGLVAVISIIFVLSYGNLKDMNIKLFWLVSFFLFSSLGFAAKEAMDRFLFMTNKK